jgi:hypothetical protein
VDAGLRLQVQRLLHFLKGRGDPFFLETLVDEKEKLKLLAG